jgi:hypothetical protein
MALQQTGYTETSADRFLLDAATIYKNVTYTAGSQGAAGTFSGDLLGATSGGTEINIEQSYRKIEVDGTSVMDVVGLNVLESAKGTIKANLKELGSENLRLALNGTKQASDTYVGYDEVNSKRYVEDGDYIENMAIVGKITGTDTPMIIMFDNVLITSALNIKTEDNNEAVIELEGQANASYDQLAANEFPWTILYPTETPSA